MPARAAQYVRMSTEHQKYSTENQSEAIQNYAARRGIEIVRTYADEGKSGLSLGGREALKRLIDDVQAKRTDFTTILVYDVSRWGRFQDADESAYYEYICKRSVLAFNIAPSSSKTTGARSLRSLKG
jgi:DNA invertase Pin-like site-specific DNA recombinase